MLALSQSTMTLNQALRQIAELKNELHTLRRIVDSQSIFPTALKLTEFENIVLRTLTLRGFATHEMLLGALYWNRAKGCAPKSRRRVLWVTVCSLREKVKPLRVYIQTRRSLGYQIGEADQNKLRELLGRK